MADLKISALTAASTPLAGTEVLPIVQSGTTKKVAVSDLTAGRSISASEVNVSTGNIGVGALSSWATAKAVQVGSYGNISSLNNSTYIGQNFYYNAGFLFQHASARYAALYEQNNFNGTHNWYSSSATGTTGNPVTLNSLATLSQAGDYTLATGNVVIGTSGKGIDFSATSGTGTSELLADYEEGTWTPVDSSGAGLGLTITGTSTYTKIGRQVIATADITYPVTVSASLTLIGGLPFTTAAAPSGAGSIGYTDYGTWITASPGGAVSSFRFIGAGGFLTNLNLSGKRVQVTIVYTV